MRIPYAQFTFLNTLLFKYKCVGHERPSPPPIKNKRWNFEHRGCRVVYSRNGFDIGIGEKSSFKTQAMIRYIIISGLKRLWLIFNAVKSGKVATRLCFDSFKHLSPRPFEVRFDRMEYHFLRCNSEENILTLGLIYVSN